MAKFAVTCRKCKRKHEWEGPALPVPGCPRCANDKSADAHDAEQALAMVDDICEACEQIPSRGQDFAESVIEKATAIGNNIEQHNRITAGQWSALQNMLDGCERWISD
jgi:hypothetical protein